MAKLEIGKEYPPLEEENHITELVKITTDILHKDEWPVRRGEHPKHHGCVKGEFIVEANLPAEMRFGIFKQPQSFPCCIRFSNGSDRADKPDSKGNARGMAVKILNVEGEKILEEEKQDKTQDFLMINHPVFPIGNIRDYLEIFKIIQTANGKPPIKFFFPGINPFKWHLQEFIIFMTIRSKKVASPLEIQYWSTTPYKLGNIAIKFSAKPFPSNSLGRSHSTKSENFLREAMVEHLESKEASFDFLVQFQTDPDKMPIEDPRIEWKSPYQKVATIKISPQKFNSPQQMKFCEELSYTPWHALPEHRPLGGINRARKQVYQTISHLRHKLNDVPRREPTEAEVSSHLSN